VRRHGGSLLDVPGLPRRSLRSLLAMTEGMHTNLAATGQALALPTQTARRSLSQREGRTGRACGAAANLRYRVCNASSTRARSGIQADSRHSMAGRPAGSTMPAVARVPTANAPMTGPLQSFHVKQSRTVVRFPWHRIFDESSANRAKVLPVRSTLSNCLTIS